MRLHPRADALGAIDAKRSYARASSLRIEKGGIRLLIGRGKTDDQRGEHL